jgi:hypothetical protein
MALSSLEPWFLNDLGRREFPPLPGSLKLGPVVAAPLAAALEPFFERRESFSEFLRAGGASHPPVFRIVWALPPVKVETKTAIGLGIVSFLSNQTMLSSA